MTARQISTFLGIRLLGIVLILLAISMVTFALLYLAPGDLVRNLIGNRAVTPELAAQVREQYHLDQSLPAQYGLWLQGVLVGDLGTSVRFGQPVTELIGSRLGATGMVAGLAFIVSVAVAVPLGVASALRPQGRLDRIVTALSLVGLSAPAFAVAILLLYVLAYYFPIFPVYGGGTGFADQLYHSVLPALTLAIGLGAIILRLTRTAVIGQLEQDYVMFARSRGMSARAVNTLVLRNAAAPVATAAGLTLTYLITGTIIAETVFALPGLGTLLQSSVLYKDIPVVQGLTLFFALVIAVIALAVDFIQLTLDPRVAARGGRS